jgi:hypothetical protein
MSRLPDSSKLPPARRTMADVTALFMSGAGPAPARPQRTPPRAASLPPVLSHINGGAVAERLEVRELSPGVRETGGAATVGTKGSPLIVHNSALHFGKGILDAVVAAKEVKAAGPVIEAVIPPATVGAKEKLPRVQAALLDHSTAGGYRVLLEAAKLLAAEHKIAIGIVGRDECVLRLSRVDGKPKGGHVATHIEAKKGPPDLQLARQLYALRQTVDHWIIAVPRIGLDLARKMLEAAPDWLLVSATDNDAIIACYRLLKGVCALANAREASIRLMLQTCDKAVATRIFARLNHVAEEFLQQELTPLTPAASATSRVEPIAEFPFVDRDGDDSEAVWTAVLEFLHDLQDIDPEEPTVGAAMEGEPKAPDENAILAASVLEASENEALLRPMAGARMQAAQSGPAVMEQASEGAEAKGEGGPGLRVCEVTTDLFLLKDALADLIPGAVFLEARSPMNAPSLLAADAAGKLHVWMMAESADMTSWGSMWQWANEHRKLIALTRPDLHLGADLPVQMHLILPSDAPRAIRTPLPGVLYYRLHALRWNGKTATAVIPLG